MPAASGLPPGKKSAAEPGKRASSAAWPCDAPAANCVDDEALLREADRGREELAHVFFFEPSFWCASQRPATLPGTPAARWPVAESVRRVSPLASRYMSRLAAAGAVSRKSSAWPVAVDARDHEAAAADVAGARVDDRERERRGDRGVDRVAAVAQHLEPDFGGERRVGHHHAVRAGRGGRVERKRPALRHARRGGGAGRSRYICGDFDPGAGLDVQAPNVSRLAARTTRR